MTAIAKVQNTEANGSAATSKAVAYTSNVVKNNLLIVAAAAFKTGGTDPVLTIADSLVSVWSAPIIAHTTAGAYLYVWYGYAASSGADTVTVTGNANITVDVSVSEWSNAALTGKDQSNSAGTANTINSQPGSVTPSKANELVITFATDDSGATTFTQDAGYTKMDDVTTGQPVHSQFQVQTAATATNPKYAWLAGASRSFAAVILTFRLATSSGVDGLHAINHVLPGFLDL